VLAYLPSGLMAGSLADGWAASVAADQDRRREARQAERHAAEAGEAASLRVSTAERDGGAQRWVMRPGDLVEAQLRGWGELVCLAASGVAADGEAAFAAVLQLAQVM
jgi:hypothetical protein